MKRNTGVLIAVFILVAGLTANAASSLCEEWQKPYSGDDAAGAHVLGLWQFKSGSETKDSSSHGSELKLQGASIANGGILGSCLESFRGHPVEDKRHAALAQNLPALSPKGAFTIEMWIKPKPELVGYPDSFLIDKKYVAHTDYQLILTAADKSGARRLAVNLGFGTDSERWISEASIYEPGVWHHIAFTYDGAGEGRFWRDGVALGGVSRPERGAVAAGKHPLSIGDRIGSNYHGFPGFIAQVRLCSGVLEFRPVAFSLASDRSAFVRMEKVAGVQIKVINRQRSKLSGAVVNVSLDGLNPKQCQVPELDAEGTHSIEYSVDTTLKPGEYKLRARLEIPGAKPYVSEESFPVVIVPRPLPRMPVVMWGIYNPDSVLKELPRLKEIGFTHCLGVGADVGSIWVAQKPIEASKPAVVEKTKRMLDTALANDFSILATLSPAHALEDKKEFVRVGRDGKIRDAKKANVCGLVPGVSEYCYNVGASVAQTYGAFPAFQGALIHTEIRDGANLCFHEADKDAYRKATGLEIPSEVTGKGGVDFAKLKDFPADRVIPDDHPLLRYLRWYWKAGDGWNGLTSAVHRGLKTSGRKDFWTFHDPAVRVASTYGSGGDVDVISQWTYSYPDPIRLGLSTDELFAMARGADHPQRVMKMTQIIWYRSQTAPMAKGDEKLKAPKTPWEDTDPDAAFPTIAPMHLREAFWTKIARPVQGIMYHGWQSLVPTIGGSEGSYRYTNPQSQHELNRLVKQVVEPLGPTLLQVPDRKSDVAFLESFASQMFARRGTYGWNSGWAGDAYHVLQYAQLQPEVVYDETIEKRGLDGFRLLVMMDCDVLTTGVVAKVKEFQRKGGKVVGDERLCPAIKPDILLETYQRTRKADEDRKALVDRATKLRAALADQAHYQPYTSSSNPDVVARCRSYGTSDYVFAINDHREFGDYVGQHGLVMENGLPSETMLSVQRKAGFVYDLLRSRMVAVTTKGKGLRFEQHLGPCEGGVFLVTDRAIEKVEIQLPSQAKLGQSVACRIAVVDKEKRPINGILPLRVEVLDPSGRECEWSGCYGAKDGQMEFGIDLAANDSAGMWQVRVHDLASGQWCDAFVRVNP